MIKRVLTVLSLVILGLATGGQAANAAPFDPTPYCRPYMGLPYVDSGPTYTGGGRYQFDVEAAGGMHCNGAAYKVSVSVTLHYSTTSGGGTGTTTGSTKTCGDSCENTAHYMRTSLFCGYHYTYDDYATVNYTWQRYSSDSPVSGSLNGGHTTGSSYNPPGVCT
ncbi:hypothetical protein ABZ671_17565 [Micromonospora sp. NPDC006766]|uniref:hypothetical protein n=1 Tax=Micromonospora sp. NPDC006766 TaxID=3154778 RepID=UPI0033C82F1F